MDANGGTSERLVIVETTVPFATAPIGAPKSGKSVSLLPSPLKNEPPATWAQSTANISGVT